MRVRKTRWKVLYVAVAVVLVFLVNGVGLPGLLPHPLDMIARNALVIALYFGGIRSFRGRGEPIEPPRAWWRMTARPKAGYVIGSLLIVSVISGVVTAQTQPPEQSFTFIFNAAVDACLVLLYFHSSIRLSVRPPATIDEPNALTKR